MTVRSLAIATWAVLGVAALLAESVVRLGGTALHAIRVGALGPTEWGALALITALLGYFEGYRGFHCSFSPRVVERAFRDSDARGPLRVALAPLYAMALVGGSRRELVRSWLLVVGIACMVVAVRALPPSWRAIVDAAVAVSMSWGLVVLGSRYLERARAHVVAAAERRPHPRASTRPSAPPA